MFGKVKSCLAAFLVVAVTLSSLQFSVYAADECETVSTASLSLEEGTYVEHQVLAYVIGYDEERDGSIYSWLFGEDSGSGDAESLVAVDALTAEEAFSNSESSVDEEIAETAEEYGYNLENALDSSGEKENTAEGQLVLIEDGSLTTEELIAKLKEDDRVIFAEPNYVTDSTKEGDWSVVNEPFDDESSYVNLDGTSEDILVSEDDETAADLNGFFYAGYNSGIMSGLSVSDAVDIDYEDWATQTETSEDDPVVVAVIDTGVDESNEDLTDALWTWSEEEKEVLQNIAGADSHGFYSGTDKNKTSTTGFSEGDEHGTHVAGVIAASWNSEGISGISSSAQIMSLRHDGTMSGILACANYLLAAVEAGVNVRLSNNSWSFGHEQSQVLNLVYTALGEAGVVSIFSSGNEGYDTDTASATASTLNNNPYVIIVNAIEDDGDLASFSNYGAATTDVMAEGVSILSTILTDYPSYLAEADSSAVLYESFDEQNEADAEGISGTGQYLTFYDAESGEETGTITSDMAFDGTAALELSYSSAESKSYETVYTEEIDLSEEQPENLSIRFRSTGALNTSGKETYGRAYVNVYVSVIDETTGETEYEKLTAETSFGAYGSWGGAWYELPENTDWEDLSLKIEYKNCYSYTKGGVKKEGCSNGSILIDSIGFGDSLVAYDYETGTSMATPVVTGVGAVLSAAYPEDSAAQLAARIKGGTVYDERYEGLSTTEGYVTVEGGNDPGAVPVSVLETGDGCIDIDAYFVDDDTEVTVNGTSADVICVSEEENGLCTITAELPEDYTGGETVVGLSGSGANAHEITTTVYLSEDSTSSYYDETDIEVPDEIGEWNAWTLAEFDGSIYVTPRSKLLFDGTDDFENIYAYDTDEGTWTAIELPFDLFPEWDEYDCAADVSAVEYNGALAVKITVENKYVGIEEYLFTMSACGEWSYVGEILGVGTSSSYKTLFYSTICSDGENLYTFGGLYNYSKDSNIIGILDLDDMVITNVGTFNDGRQEPDVSYNNGSFVVSGGYKVMDDMLTGEGAEIITCENGSWSGSSITLSTEITWTGQDAYASAAVGTGFVLVGAENDAGTADTYTINIDGSGLKAYGQRASDQALLNPSAAYCNGKIYVLAATTQDPYRVFCATAITYTGTVESAEEETSGKSSSSSLGSSLKDDASDSVTISGITYRIASKSKKTAKVVSVDESQKSAKIAAKVKIDGVTYKVTKVKASAFANHKKLKRIVIGKNIKNIGKKAFSGCSSLKVLKIKSKKIKKIGKKAFLGTSKIKLKGNKTSAIKKMLKKAGAAIK